VEGPSVLIQESHRESRHGTTALRSPCSCPELRWKPQWSVWDAHFPGVRYARPVATFDLVTPLSLTNPPRLALRSPSSNIPPRLPSLPYDRTFSPAPCNKAPPFLRAPIFTVEDIQIAQAPHQPMSQVHPTSKFPSPQVAHVIHGPFASLDCWKDYYCTQDQSSFFSYVSLFSFSSYLCSYNCLLHLSLLASNIAAPSSSPSSTCSLSHTLIPLSKFIFLFGHRCPSSLSPGDRIRPRPRAPVFTLLRFSPTEHVCGEPLATRPYASGPIYETVGNIVTAR